MSSPAPIETLAHRVIIEGGAGRRLSDEDRAVVTALSSRGEDIVRLTIRQLRRDLVAGELPSLVAGTIPFVEEAMRHLGMTIPEPDDYPSVLEPFFHRTIWTSTIGTIRSQAETGANPVFVKPLERRKRFAGCVIRGLEDLWQLASIGSHVKILCADVVEWVSDWRVFVCRNEVVGIKHYAGDVLVEIDQFVTKEVVDRLASAPTCLDAYAVDLGLLSTGETALVECNDGYGVGSYDLAPDAYVRVLEARWAQLVSSTTPN